MSTHKVPSLVAFLSSAGPTFAPTAIHAMAMGSSIGESLWGGDVRQSHGQRRWLDGARTGQGLVEAEGGHFFANASFNVQ